MKNRSKLHTKLRYTIHGTAARPRLAVFRSLKNVNAQLIDDEKGVTLAGITSIKMRGSRSQKAKMVGEAIAEKAKELKITAVVFDRGGFQYHGVVKAVAEAAREKGLTI